MRVILQSSGLRPITRHHPWIFSGAVSKVEGDPQSGDVVMVTDGGGNFLAYGHYHPWSRIRVRLLSFRQEEEIDAEWWRSRIARSVNRRIADGRVTDTGAVRLIFSESDGLPGLVADWYAGTVVIQSATPGIDAVKGLVVETLAKLLSASCVYERSDSASRRLEGLEKVSGPLLGRPSEGRIQVEEHGYRLGVDVIRGQKTGHYLDQRDNRRETADRVLAGRSRVLDCYAHTGAFAAAAIQAGAAAVTLVESSAEAIQGAKANLDGLSTNVVPEIIQGDAHTVLRNFRDQGRTFDLIVLDPPKLAPSRAQASKAARAYKDINLLAMKLMTPEGVLATFSCSGGIDETFFQQILFGAAMDAGRDVQIMKRLGQPADHPVLLSFPESAYLKGFLTRVL